MIEATSAPAYSYDPYGNALQSTAPLTDFGYAGMLYNTDSGLYLTQYRVYDPANGRWLSRDPIGEVSRLVGTTIPVLRGNPLGVTVALLGAGSQNPRVRRRFSLTDEINVLAGRNNLYASGT